MKHVTNNAMDKLTLFLLISSLPIAVSAKKIYLPECSDLNLIKWVGASPHTPLAVVDNSKVRSAGQLCCIPWALKDSLWTAVDEDGQNVGQVTMTDFSWHGVSRCYEYKFTPIAPKQPALYVSKQGRYQNPTNTVWVPSPEENQALLLIRNRDLKKDENLLKTRSHAENRDPALPYACADNASDLKPFSIKKEAWFFQFPLSETLQRYAAISGLRLHIYKLTKHAKWIEVYTNPLDFTALCRWEQPFAIFDMNDDGIPEIIFHSSEGSFWGDLILRFNPQTKRFQQAAKGIFGPSA